MNLMLSQLELEADQMYNFIPFDLRMGQVITTYIYEFENIFFVCFWFDDLYSFFFFVSTHLSIQILYSIQLNNINNINNGLKIKNKNQDVGRRFSWFSR
jgi:hypothetical protein